MGSGAMGHQAKFGTGATGSAVTEPFEFVSETLRKIGRHIETGGIRGTRSHRAANVNTGPYTVGGNVLIPATPVDFDVWLPRILGAAESTDVFALAETLPDFVAQFDRVTKVFAYSGCKVNKGIFRSSAGNDLMLDLDIQGKKEGAYSGTTFTEGSPGNSGTFPSLTLGELQPYTHDMLVFTFNSVAYELDNLEIEVDNALILDRFNNSLTRTSLPEGDRIIKVTADFPYTTDEDELYAIALGGLAATAVWTNGNRSLSFSFVKLQAPPESPTVASRTAEIKHRVSWIARETSSVKELVVTNDSSG